MAVYTQVNRTDIERLLVNYNIGQLVSFVGIAEGVENSNYLIETTSARYILTLFEKRVHPSDLPYFMALKTHLAGANFLCPLPQNTHQGQIVGTLAGRPAVIVSFLEGRSTTGPSPQNASEFGRAMAQMHLATSNFEMTRPNDLTYKAWVQMWGDLRPKCERLFPEILPLVDTAFARLTSWDTSTKTLPRGTVHADLFLDNVFFKDNHFSGFIDFYFACTDYLAYDLAISLGAWAFNDTDHTDGPRTEFLPEIAMAITSAYGRVRPLTAQERTQFPMLMTGAALRFFLTRLADWDASPEGAVVIPKNPLPFAHRLAFAMETDQIDRYGL